MPRNTINYYEGFRRMGQAQANARGPRQNPHSEVLRISVHTVKDHARPGVGRGGRRSSRLLNTRPSWDVSRETAQLLAFPRIRAADRRSVGLVGCGTI